MTQPDGGWEALRRPGTATLYFDLRDPPGVEPEAPSFSAGTAWWLAELCRLAYRRHGSGGGRGGGGSRGEILARVGLRESCTFHRAATHAMLVESAGRQGAPFAALVFRGTQGWANIRSNLNAPPVRWPVGDEGGRGGRGGRGGAGKARGGRVHLGFARALEAVWGEIEGALDGIGAALLVTGHSLGAALATLASSRLAASGTAHALFTFGSPRVGDARFGATLDGVATYRVVNGHDAVTLVPPGGWPCGFRHVGVPIRLARPRDQVRRRWSDPPAILADHAPVNYLASLEQALAAAEARLRPGCPSTPRRSPAPGSRGGPSRTGRPTGG